MGINKPHTNSTRTNKYTTPAKDISFVLEQDEKDIIGSYNKDDYMTGHNEGLYDECYTNTMAATGTYFEHKGPKIKGKKRYRVGKGNNNLDARIGIENSK